MLKNSMELKHKQLMFVPITKDAILMEQIIAQTLVAQLIMDLGHL